MDDRRNDIGQKILIGIILSAFGIVLGVFINSMIVTAAEGKGIALENKVEIVEIKANYESIKEDLDEIKMLLKRSIPYRRSKMGV